MILIALQLVVIAILVSFAHEYATQKKSWFWAPALIAAFGVAISVASHIPA